MIALGAVVMSDMHMLNIYRSIYVEFSLQQLQLLLDLTSIRHDLLQQDTVSLVMVDLVDSDHPFPFE